MNKTEVVHQTKLAFDFIQKLYMETSYLIKEIEGLLAEEDENFVIGKTSGYSITNRSSSGLEANNVNFWAIKKLAVFFVANELTKSTSGMTNTGFTDTLKLIYIRIILDEKDIVEPYIFVSVFHDFIDKQKGKMTKFEQLMATMEYYESKFVRTGTEILNYEDSNVVFKGKVFKVNLYDINSSDNIVDQIITPVLDIYRKI